MCVCVQYSLVRLSLLHMLQWIIIVAGANRSLIVVDVVEIVPVLHGYNNSVHFDVSCSV